MNDEFVSSADNSRVVDLLSLHEVAELTGLSHSHIRLLIRKGEIKGWKIARNWTTTEEAVTEYLSKDRKPGPKKP